MSSYTMELKTVLEALTGKTKPTSYSEIDDMIVEACPIVFENYEIFDESYRLKLNRHILGSYLFREIGDTPYSRWLWRLNEKMRDIMPYFNQLYKSAMLEFNPLYDVDYSRTGSREGSSNDTTEETYESNTTSDSTDSNTTELTVNNTGNNVNAHSNTPQGSLDNAKDLKYLSDVTVTDDKSNGTSKNISSGSSEGHGSQNDTRNSKTGRTSKDGYGEMVKGKMGSKSYAEMLQEYRKTFLNIDNMVVKELEELFFQLY